MSQASVVHPKLCPACGSRYAVDALFCPVDGSPLSNTPGSSPSSGPAHDPYVGRDLLGHIEIRQLAGVGAMGRVYRAFQKGIDRDVAVKILHRELSANQQLVARFHREAKVASRLTHPHVVTAYLTGQLPDGAMYIVMEYLDGMSLQSALAAAGDAMPLARALHVALQICDAAGEAHAQGIVHRDIKPENVMLVRRADDTDYVKVLDFGIARLNWGDQSMATAAGLIFGTARYISPEGAQGEPVGPQGDVYAIATLVYQMLAGRTPFEGEQAVGLLIQQIHDMPPPLRSIPRASYVPEPIAQAIMKNLAKSSATRDTDARAFGRALLEAAKRSGMSADDLLARPAVMGQRPAGPVQLPSMQATRQLELEPHIAAQLGIQTSKSSGTPPPTKTTYETPDPSGIMPSRARDPLALAPGAATAKWEPPPGFQASLAPQPPSIAPTRKPGVDDTLDEDDGVVMTPPPPPRTASTPERSDPSYPALPRVPPISEVTRPTLESASRPSRTAPGVEEDLRLPKRHALRAVVLVITCFLVGTVGATAVAYKFGFIGKPEKVEVAREQFVARSMDALLNHRYDAPPGECVRDLTSEGLAKWPNDRELLRIRALAADDLSNIVRSRRVAGDLGEALRFAKLAVELDASDDAKKLAAECEQELQNTNKLPPLAAEAGAPSDGGGREIRAREVRATLDATVGKPRIGQPVDFIARIVPVPAGASLPRIDGAQLVIAGPGLGGTTRVSADGAGSSFKGTYTFLEGGRYEVVFTARAEGTTIRVARVVFVGEGGAPALPIPSTSPSTQVPLPAPSGSGKWL